MTSSRNLQKDPMVHHPTHYNRGIECWDYTTSHQMCFLQGNVVKYVTRFRDRDGLKDLYKAKQYLDKLIESEKIRAGLEPGPDDIRLEERERLLPTTESQEGPQSAPAKGNLEDITP